MDFVSCQKAETQLVPERKKKEVKTISLSSPFGVLKLVIFLKIKFIYDLDSINDKYHAS